MATHPTSEALPTTFHPKIKTRAFKDYSDIPLFLYYSLSDKYFGRSRLALAWFCQTKVWTPFLEIRFVKKIGFL
jgi:hypothetical protein